ncbi:hypothetical protein EDD15DRAFT_2349970 [Pisolithus albus]|nr:hypothetical protein EDD15DRAFT_2349970 [Pisolithus albus]
MLWRQAFADMWSVLLIVVTDFSPSTWREPRRYELPVLRCRPYGRAPFPASIWRNSAGKMTPTSNAPSPTYLLCSGSDTSRITTTSQVCGSGI